MKNSSSFLDRAIVESPFPEKLTFNNDQHNKGNFSVRFLQSTFNEVKLEVTTNLHGMLILQDQFYPGWHATINGKKSTIYNVNYLFRGVHVEAGTSLINFVYRPMSFYLGLFLSSISVLCLLGILIINNRKQKG